MRRGICILLFLLIVQFISGQETTILKGIITFKAAENIYIRFENTELIAAGDTLFRDNEIATPCLVVTRKSSSSVVGHTISGCSINKNDTVYYLHIPSIEIEEIREELDPNVQAENISKEIDPIDIIPDPDEKNFNFQYKERIIGRISAASQSNFTNIDDQDRHRMILRFTMDAANISNSKFSFQSYINYRKNYISSNLNYSSPTSFYNVYNLALTYQLDSLSSLSIGRKINQKISSLGPIDGLQVEKFLGNFYLGSILGFKPNISDFGFNADLLEYGGYIGHLATSKNIYSLSTFGLLEQRNKMNIDRRYAYLQHSSTLSNKINFFVSAELDLFENVDGITSTNLRLSNIYSSISFRPIKKLSVSLSYDARKRIILYETFRTEIEQLLADDQARQGIRLRINFNPIKNVNGGITFSKRFQKDSDNKSNNINGYISHSNLPSLKGRININFNLNKSNYLESAIFSFRYSRSLIRNTIDGEFYYRYADYNYFTSENKLNQQFYGTGLSFRLSKQLILSILGEYSNREKQDNLRLNTRIIKRFYRK
jgi:hypothetical protein